MAADCRPCVALVRAARRPRARARFGVLSSSSRVIIASRYQPLGAFPFRFKRRTRGSRSFASLNTFPFRSRASRDFVLVLVCVLKSRLPASRPLSAFSFAPRRQSVPLKRVRIARTPSARDARLSLDRRAPIHRNARRVRFLMMKRIVDARSREHPRRL